MFSGRESGALAFPITSRIAIRRPLVSDVSNPAPSGDGWTISGIYIPISAFWSAEGRLKRTVAVKSWQKLQPWGAPSRSITLT